MANDRGREDTGYLAEGQEPPKFGAPSGEHHARPMPQSRLTLEEIQVLRECNQESFWYRCVPLGVVFIGSTQIMVNRGILRPNPRFGALFKNLAAGFAAFVVGKWSYRNVCREKILQLQNSPLADAIRRGRGGGLSEAMRDQDAVESYVENQPPRTRRRDPAFDTPGEQRGLDDSLRPSLDNFSPSRPSQSGETTDRHVTYDELRRQNRAEYGRKQHSGVGGLDHSQPIVRPPDVEQSQKEPSVEAPKRNVKRNKYGDEIES